MNSKKVFGTKLSDVMARPEEQGIPRCCRELFGWIIKHGRSIIIRFFQPQPECPHPKKGLGVEGLFRVSAGVKEMDDIKSKYDRGNYFVLEQL